jgi:hypothetical protein
MSDRQLALISMGGSSNRMPGFHIALGKPMLIFPKHDHHSLPQIGKYELALRLLWPSQIDRFLHGAYLSPPSVWKALGILFKPVFA